MKLAGMGFKPLDRVDALLDELCRVYGYCLPPDEWERLVAAPPQDLDAFVDAILAAEGEDPELVDKRARTEVSEVVREWLFDDGRGKGTSSGLA